MSTKKRRSFDPAIILTILKRHLVDKVPVSNLCDEYKIHPTDFYRWQKKLFEESQEVFRRKSNGIDSESKRLRNRLEAAEKKITKKNEVLSELMEEHVQLKKKLGPN